MPKEIECIIKGRVQMVMFRDFARREAKALDIVGLAKNLDDGSARVVAQGDEDKLKEFIEKLKTGPQYAEVEDMNVKWREITKKFDDFEIIY